jgi:transposase InsO family protein
VPWKGSSVVDQRKALVVRRAAGERMTDLCREFGISRKQAYKFYERYKLYGLSGLDDGSRRPHSHPNKTPVAIEELVIRERDRRPTWGSKKLSESLRKRHAGVHIPSRGTIEEILRRNGLVSPRKKRRRVPVYPEKLTQSTAPNEVWCADFKGQFRLGDGSLCYPLTITDHFSRMILACVALEATTAEAVFGVFDGVFTQYGLPSVIRTDNGCPFASRGLGGFSQVSAWWSSLGIRHERTEPGHPEQNGRHERMHRTLKQETTRPPSATIAAQQQRFDDFVMLFNTERPHEALEMQTPSCRYAPSMRIYPRQLDTVEYPLHDAECRVATSGMFGLPGSKKKFFLTRAFAGHYVGLRELDDGRWLVSFGKLDLGHITADQSQFVPLGRKAEMEVTAPII